MIDEYFMLRFAHFCMKSLIQKLMAIAYVLFIKIPS